MSNLVPADCFAGVVSVSGIPVPGAEILSEGQGLSSGVLALDQANAFYITNTAKDLAATLEKLTEALDKAVLSLNAAASALTTHDTAGYLIAATAGVPSPPLAAASIADITANSSEVATLSLQLQVLRESLA